MAFYAANFVFNDIPSENFGLRISSNNGEESTDASSDVTFVTQRVFRKPVLYLLGVSQDKILTFPVSFRSERKIDAIMATQIQKTLFGQIGYKKLQVIAPDYDQYYWNCYLSSPKIVRVGNEIVGWDADVVCDSPWGYTFAKTLTYSYTSPVGNSPILFNNRSGNNDYIPCQIIVTMANTGGNFTIINTSDNNRNFTFSGLAANEIVATDNSVQIITSSLGYNRVPNFNYGWLRFLPGRNDLLVSGQIIKLEIKYRFAQKIGG